MKRLQNQTINLKLFFILIFVCIFPNHLYAQNRPKLVIPDWEKVDWNNWKNLDELIQHICDISSIPSISAVIVKDGKIIDMATIGIREVGTQDSVQATDVYHIGSLTKSMTASIIGKLVEDGLIDWTTTLEEALPRMKMRDAYKKVTIDQLLHHQGGIQSFDSDSSYRTFAMQTYKGSSTEKRKAFLTKVLNLEPYCKPGEKTLYTNAGYSLAGYIAEYITGMSWEQLMQKHIFLPNHMTNSGFGHPGTKSLPNQPKGHALVENEFISLEDSDYPHMEIIAPAGDVHCSAEDLGLYAISHLNGLQGKDGYLQAETIKKLHTLPNTADAMAYASGWFIRKNKDSETIHYHDGTTGAFYATLTLYPARNTGIGIMMNVDKTYGELVCNKLGRSLLERYSPANIIAESSTPKLPSGFSFQQKPEGDATTDSLELQLSGTPTDAEVEKIWHVVKLLAESYNNEDFESNLKLFNKKEESQNQMFEFMTNQVLPRSGGIHGFHDIQSGTKIPNSKYPFYIITFHLENGKPGYFGVCIDENGKIDNYSLFIMPSLCPNGTDTNCDKVVKILGKDL